MRARWTWKSGIQLTLALIFLGLGGDGVRSGLKQQEHYDSALTAKPMEGATDLSKPGELIFPFIQSYSRSHGEVVGLRVPPEVLEKTEAEELIRGLKVRLVITDKGGAVMQACEPDELMLEVFRDPQLIPLFRLNSFKKGSYQAKFIILEGVPALSGIPQQMEARYLLCGCERMAGQMVLGLGVVLALPGLFLGWWGLRGLFRRPPETGA